MADTLNALVHDKIVPKLIETNNFMIINGNLYHKGNLAPTSKKIFSFGSELGNNILHMNKTMHLTDSARIGTRDKAFKINEDPYDASITYCLVNCHYSNVNNTYSYILKFKEEDDNITLQASYSLQNIEFKNILDITDNYLFVTGCSLTVNLTGGGRSSGSYGNYNYVYAINKNDMTLNKTLASYMNLDVFRGKTELIMKDINYIYLFTNGYGETWGHYRYFYSSDIWAGEEPISKDGFWITKINKNNLDVSIINKMLFTNLRTLYDSAEEGLISSPPQESFKNFPELAINGDILRTRYNTVKVQTLTVLDFYEINDYIYWLIFDTNTRNNHYFYKISYNKKASFENAITSSSIDCNPFGNNIKYLKEAYSSGDQYWIFNNRLYYLIYDETNAADTLDIQGLYYIDINGEFNLTFNKKEQINNQQRIISFLLSDDKEILIIGYYQSFELMTYNDVTQEYQKMGNTYTGIKNVGLDALNRLWYETNSGEIHTENFDDPQEVEVKFEKPYYSYAKSPIHTYLTFKAKSTAGAVPSGRYTLTITSNNAYFEETGDNVLYIEYNNVSQDDIHYPVIITAAKRVVCSISFEKAW